MFGYSRGTALFAASLAAALTGLVAPVQAEGEPDSAPQRVMVLGDSISHGSTGDWTWRYRLWRHLQDTADATVDLVGPADTVWENSAAYADPDLDQDHASRWGNSLAVRAFDVTQATTNADPDVVVVQLGFNDLTWQRQQPAEVVSRMRSLVGELRSAAPGVDVVIVRIPVVQWAGVPEANDGFTALAGELDTADERVVAANADAGFVTSAPGNVEDTYDAAHPSSRGELKIAASVADALSTLGIGAPYRRPLPVLPLGPRTGAVLTASPADHAIALEWTSAPGTTSEQLWLRDVTAGTGWVGRGEFPTATGLTTTTSTGLRNGHAYEVVLRPAKGWAQAVDTFSNRVTAVPRAADPPVPDGLHVTALDHGAKLSWTGVRQATSYEVLFRRAATDAVWRVRPAADAQATVFRLWAGARYQFRVRAVDDGTIGRSTTSQLARPTGPRPVAPANLRAAVNRRADVLLRWTTAASATHYVAWKRNVTKNGPWRRVLTPNRTTVGQLVIPSLRRGTTYRFLVRAWHQGVPGGVSSTVRVAVPRSR